MKSEPDLCDDEGCEHYGTPHVCITRVEGSPPHPASIDPDSHLFRLVGPAWHDDIDEEVKMLGIEAYVSRDERQPGYALYAVPISALDKLPRDSDGVYLPHSPDSGFSLYPMPDANEFRQQARYGDWERV